MEITVIIVLWDSATKVVGAQSLEFYHSKKVKRDSDIIEILFTTGSQWFTV